MGFGALGVLPAGGCMRHLRLCPLTLDPPGPSEPLPVPVRCGDLSRGGGGGQMANSDLG